jgi:hypothetical protein
MRLKESSINDDNNNKIASLMAKSNSQITREENETLVLHIIDQLIQKGNNKDLINKISAVSSQPMKQRQKGEVAEFQTLIRSFR